VRDVFVNGEQVVQDGELTKVNEKALIAELRGRYEAFSAHHKGVEDLNRRFEPYFKAIHLRCCQEDLGLNRMAAKEEEWLLG
jgi:hypothetical protein